MEEETITQETADTQETSTQEQTDTTDTQTQETEDFQFQDDGKGPEETQTTEETSNHTQTEDTTDDTDKLVQQKVEKVLSEKLKPFAEQAQVLRVQNEWGKISRDYPELKTFEAKILRYAQHSSYRDKSVMDAVLAVAGADTFVKIGAKRAKEANQEATHSRGGGGGFRPQETRGNINGPDLRGMTEAQINAELAKARQQSR